MVNRNSDAQDCNIIESMNQAFDNGSFMVWNMFLMNWSVKNQHLQIKIR